MKKDSNKAKVIVFGMDGATFNLADCLIDGGDMPALKSIVDSGCRAPLEPTTPWHSAPAWTSCTTGVLPAKHGILNFMGISGALAVKPVDNSDVRAERIWSILHRHGVTTGIFNVPVTYPVNMVNGFMVSGTPHSCRQMHPQELKKEFPRQLEVINNRQLAMRDGERFIIPEYLARKRMEQDTARWEILDSILDRGIPDFIMVVFAATDEMQHSFWHTIDTHHPYYDINAFKSFGSFIPSAYIGSDRKLEALLGKAAGPETTVIVVSDHGFGPAYRMFYPNKLLAEMGFLVHGQRPAENGNARAADLADQLGFDPLLTKAYCPTSTSCDFAGIILLASGDRACESLPRDEYEILRNTVAGSLLQWTDPISGLAPVKKTFFGEILCQNPDMRITPDIFIYCPGFNCQPDLSVPSTVYDNVPFCLATKAQTGCHSRFGIFAASGPGIKQNSTLPAFHMANISPLILRLFNIPIPDYFDGSVPESVLDPGFTGYRLYPDPGKQQGPAEAGLSLNDEKTYSGVDEEAINTLKGLGYL